MACHVSLEARELDGSVGARLRFQKKTRDASGGIPEDEIASAIERLKKKGMVRSEGSFYKISGIHAE